MRINQIIKYLALAAFCTAYLVPVVAAWLDAGVITQTWMGAPTLSVGVALTLAEIILKVAGLQFIGATVVSCATVAPFWLGTARQPEWLYVIALAVTVYAVAWLADRDSPVNACE